MSKISPSSEGACERVIDSVQPVHSWNGSQMTEGRRAFSSALAICGTIDGGSAISDAVAVQYFMKPRRETPCAASASPKVCSLRIAREPL